MAPSSAIEIASGNTARTSAQVTLGKCGIGRLDGTAPKRSPIVSTGIPNNCTAAVVATIATSEPGTRGKMRGQIATSAVVPRPIAIAASWTSPRCAQ